MKHLQISHLLFSLKLEERILIVHRFCNPTLVIEPKRRRERVGELIVNVPSPEVVTEAVAATRTGHFMVTRIPSITILVATIRPSGKTSSRTS